MSYPISLDEFSEKDLNAELERRRRLRDQGKCDYCQQLGNTPDCKFPDRHAVARQHWQHLGQFNKPNYDPE